MSDRQRISVFVILGGLWLTGCLWLVLDQFFARISPFGTTTHPWQPAILLAHGIIALAAISPRLGNSEPCRSLVAGWAATIQRHGVCGMPDFAGG